MTSLHHPSHTEWLRSEFAGAAGWHLFAGAEADFEARRAAVETYAAALAEPFDPPAAGGDALDILVKAGALDKKARTAVSAIVLAETLGAMETVMSNKLKDSAQAERHFREVGERGQHIGVAEAWQRTDDDGWERRDLLSLGQHVLRVRQETQRAVTELCRLEEQIGLLLCERIRQCVLQAQAAYDAALGRQSDAVEAIRAVTFPRIRTVHGPENIQHEEPYVAVVSAPGCWGPSRLTDE